MRVYATSGTPRHSGRPPAAMCRGALGSILATALVLLGSPVQAADVPAVPADHPERMKEGLALFRDHVKPALVANCLDCHGGKATKADFDLSRRESLMASGVLDAEKAEESYFYALIAHTEEPKMPLKGDRLPDATRARIARWIDLGAPYDGPLVAPAAIAEAEAPATDANPDRDFWSFRPLEVVAPPRLEGKGKDIGWARTPIDRFIRAKLEEKGLTPNPEASRRVLIRRATFDLTGLPPTPEESAAFEADPSPTAFEDLVDRLLEGPRYGERWARHWMDVARFAESHGYEQDYDRPYAYHYRDFLIRALNDDMPFDTFASWQIAGDELAPDEPMALAATGFLGAGAFPTQLTEAEFESARYDELDSMAATTGSAFLGLTVGCARCHDHKFDPIPAEDYYRLAANFTATIRSEIDVALEPGAEPVKMQVTSEGFPHTKHNADPRGFPHFYPETYVLQRGDVRNKAGVAEPGYLRVLIPEGREAADWRVEAPEGWDRTRFDRASLANWLTDPDGGAGHLLARVIVNRVWQHHFGRGIVATPDDFGLQGEAPSHPKLLDWLAADLIHQGWTLKRLHRLIMTSAVYRQDGSTDAERLAIDPTDVDLWRMAPRRLEAEAIRDAILAVSGGLDLRMAGPGTLDERMNRRSVYFFIKRSQLIPSLMLFDWPEHLVSIGRRSVTTTAPQALMFLNGPEVRRSAEGFATRLPGDSVAEAVRLAYRIGFGREPRPSEVEQAADFVDAQSSAYARDGVPHPRKLALVDFCQALLGMSEFIYIE